MKSTPYMAWNAPMFRAWFRGAAPGELCFYHSGSLAQDREKDSELMELADLIAIIHDGGAISLRQFRTSLPITDVWTYVAVRSRGGHAPASVLAGTLTPVEYRALRAIRDRDADISATRAIRDATSRSSSDVGAAIVLDALKRRSLIEPAPGRGWQVSNAGYLALT